MGSSSGSTNTTTQVQQIPAFEQQESQSNQALANSLGAQAYPTYQGALQAGFNPQQTQSFADVNSAAGAAAPNLAAGTNAENAGVAAGAGYGQNLGAAAQNFSNSLALNPTNAAALNSYMSPYVGASLAPQIQQLNTQLGQEQNQIGSQATEANAFGDARQGAQSALANNYANQSLDAITAQGYNTAFTNALQSMNQQQQAGLTAGQSLLSAGMTGTEAQQQADLTAGTNLANIGQAQQSTGLAGANALYDSGALQQNQQQEGLNLAYQQYENQVQWPYQMLNVRESALSNSPYDMSNQVTLPNANSTASALGSFSSLAGGLGSLLGNSGGSSSSSPFGQVNWGS